MKITMYELLGLVKDGKAPKKIIYSGYIWEYKEETYYSNNTCIYDWCNMMNVLDDEVEILEEKKIPVKYVNTYVLCDSDFETKGQYSLKATEIIDKAFEEYSHKINEIIDYLKSKGDE